jgi:hypothetical protein
MTLPEILSQLEPYTGRFPMKAMRAAVEQREAITPELLKVLETCDAVAFAKREDYILHVFALNAPSTGRGTLELSGEGRVEGRRP